MCNLRILTSTRNGYAAQCIECNNLEIVFGTSVIRFHLTHLEKFISYLDKISRQHAALNTGRKNIVLDIASIDTFQMILSPEELLDLRRLTDRIDEEVKTNALLNLFDS